MSLSTIESLKRAFERGETFHLIDTETTGMRPGEARVIELATVTLRGGTVVDRFETFIDPGVEVPRRITAITGITSRMLEGAPSPAQALAAWRRYLGTGGHFVAHNAPFDIGMLQAEFGLLGFDWPFDRHFCTVRLARSCMPGRRSYSLESLIHHFRIPVSDRHRALADVEATTRIFLTLLGAEGEAPPPAAPPPAAPASGGAWERVLDRMRLEHRLASERLRQLGAWQQAPEGLILRLPGPHKAWFEAQRTPLEALALAVRAEFGSELLLEEKA